MFVGHFAAGLAGKQLAPATSLASLLTAALFPDLLWCVLLAAGVEHVRLQPGITAVNHLDLWDIAISHSLLTDLLWAGGIAAAYYGRRRYKRGAWVLFATVLSHWVLDWASHRPDMPLAPGVERYFGLGLWNSAAATLAVEGGLWSGAVAVYARRTHAKTRGGVYGFWAVIAVLTVLWVNSLFAPPPPSVATVEIVNLVMLPAILVWAVWMGRVRLSMRAVR